MLDCDVSLFHFLVVIWVFSTPSMPWLRFKRFPRSDCDLRVFHALAVISVFSTPWRSGCLLNYFSALVVILAISAHWLWCKRFHSAHWLWFTRFQEHFLFQRPLMWFKWFQRIGCDLSDSRVLSALVVTQAISAHCLWFKRFELLARDLLDFKARCVF